MKHISLSWPLRSATGFGRRRGPGFGRRGVAVLAAALLAVSPVAAAHAAPDAGSGAPNRAAIYRELGLDQEPADYVILVDTSGSMAKNGRYSTVRSTLRPFLDGLTAKDHVALFTFDSRPEARYIGAAANTKKIISSLPAKPNSAGETDIGAALNAALNELGRDDASSVASVVLLTDGKHHPPHGSPYPTAEGAPWDALRGRAKGIAQRTDLAGYALPLGSGATGAQLLGNVVQNTTVLQPRSIQDLGSYLARAGDGARARKAALMLAQDAGKGVSATWQGGPADVTDGRASAKLTLRSTTRHLPLTVEGLRASLTDPSLDVSGLPAEVTLRPGASRTFEVGLRGRLPAGALPYRRTEHRAATLRLAGRVGSSWERPLAGDVKLDIPRAIRVGQQTVPLRATVGSVVLLPALLTALVLLGLGAWLWWRRVNQPLLRGELVMEPAFGEQLPVRVRLDGRRVTLEPSPSVGGRGRVQGRLRSTERGPEVDLRIRYTPDGSTARESRATCPPGGKVVVGGVSFTHVPEPARAPAEGLPR